MSNTAKKKLKIRPCPCMKSTWYTGCLASVQVPYIIMHYRSLWLCIIITTIMGNVNHHRNMPQSQAKPKINTHHIHTHTQGFIKVVPVCIFSSSHKLVGFTINGRSISTLLRYRICNLAKTVTHRPKFSSCNNIMANILSLYTDAIHYTIKAATCIREALKRIDLKAKFNHADHIL